MWRVLDVAEADVTTPIPPHSYEAEVAVLGSMILDALVIQDVMVIVAGSTDFYDEAHAMIYRAVVESWDRNYPGKLDLILVQNRLREWGAYEKIGGDGKLRDLVESVPSASNAPYYARIVADKAKLRRVIDLCVKTTHAAYHVGGSGPDTVREVIDEHEAAIFELGQTGKATGAVAIGTLVQKEMGRLDKADTSTPIGTYTGFHELDKMTQGLQDGEVTIVAGRPSMGKTAWGLAVVAHIGINGTPIGVFSMEMGSASITQRILSERSGVSSSLIRAGVVGIGMNQLVRAAGSLSEAPIFIDDVSSLTVMELRARARRMVKQYGVRVLMIDYLQLMTAPGARDGRTNEVSVISRGIKALARELNIPVVCLSQLNRSSETRQDNRPRMADLRESGAIEQDADVILLLHREAYYHVQDRQWCEENYDRLNLAEVIVAKQRNGPTGVVELTWHAETTRFANRGA